MRRILTTTAISSFYLLSLTACVTAPNASTLMTGIDGAELSTTLAPGEMRKAEDPVCVNFYKNAQNYAAQANRPNQGRNFLTTLGISILAGVASGGIASSGINSTVGQIAAQQAASSAIYQGGTMAVQGMGKSNGPAAKIVAAADQLGCPVSLT